MVDNAEEWVSHNDIPSEEDSCNGSGSKFNFKIFPKIELRGRTVECHVAGCRNQLIRDLALDSFAGRCVILGGARQQLSAQLQTQLLPQFVASSSSFRFDS